MKNRNSHAENKKMKNLIKPLGQSGILQYQNIRSERKGRPDLNILFIYNIPFRSIAKMTGGWISIKQKNEKSDKATWTVRDSSIPKYPSSSSTNLKSFSFQFILIQCINFPLQRNITFKSHGNPVYQAGWYLAAWVVISLTCNGFNNLWMPVASIYIPPAAYNCNSKDRSAEYSHSTRDLHQFVPDFS